MHACMHARTVCYIHARVCYRREIQLQRWGLARTTAPQGLALGGRNTAAQHLTGQTGSPPCWVVRLQRRAAASWG